MSIDLASTLLAPPILFFLLGMGAGFVRSDLSIPEAVSKTLALYLMLCIGFKGGVAARAEGFHAEMAMVALLGVGLSVLLPLCVFPAVRRLCGLDQATAAGLAAAYGSVSLVTFAAAGAYFAEAGSPAGGYMAAVLALMEAPAILVALLLARGTTETEGRGQGRLHEVFTNGALVVLAGSFLIGLATGASGLAKLSPFVVDLFPGVLCLFLLDMGLVASRALTSGRRIGGPLLASGVLIPLSGGLVAGLLSALFAVPAPEAAMLMVLAASASYIAVPAAMRLALPQADPGVYVTVPLAVTFPFNLLIGIPLCHAMATRFLTG